jgi:hypothetical protein
MGKEVLAGAVLDLHERDEKAAERLLRSERDFAIHLLRRLLRTGESWQELGRFKADVETFLAPLGYNPSITRFAQQQAIEREITHFNADPREALELLGAISGALSERYGEPATQQVRECIQETEEALSELERTLADLDPADASSGRIARLMEREQMGRRS